jgi:hypothetical protein
MAAKVPVSAGTTGHVNVRNVFGGITAEAGTRLTSGTRLSHIGAQLEIYPFTAATASDIDDGDQWTSGIPNIIACAWQPDVANDDLVAPTLITQATGVIDFSATNATNLGWLWVLRGK